MAKIREDLIGVVSAGEYVLKPGDEVPSGVTVGSHVLAPDATPAAKPGRKPRTRKSEE